MQDALCRGRSTATLDAMNSYAAVVTAYGTLPSERGSSRAKLKSFLKWFETRKSIEEVINAAVLRNHPHQNCLSRAKREVVAGNLVAAGAGIAKPFQRLDEAVLHRIGEGFAVDGSPTKADASRQKGIDPHPLASLAPSPALPPSSSSSFGPTAAAAARSYRYWLSPSCSS